MKTAKIESWINWFDAQESSDLVNKSHQEALFKTFDASILEDECEKKLIESQEFIFLFRENFGDDKVNIFHHVNISGGSFYDSSKK